VSDDRTAPSPRRHARPGVTACSLCVGETLGERDPLEGGQLSRLQALAGRGVADLSLSECLDECERGDVVVARPSPEGRRLAGRPVWFERLAGDALTDELADWLQSGGPGVLPTPESLVPLQIDRGQRGADVSD